MKILGTITVEIESELIKFTVYDQTFKINPLDPFQFWTVVRTDEIDSEIKPLFFLVVGKAVQLYDTTNREWYDVALIEDHLSIINKLQEAHAKRL